MFTTKIPYILKNFYSPESPLRTILFDGKWGCGKTYNVNLFLNGQDVPNYIYVSLFGIESVNDIVLRLAEKLDSKYIVNMDGDYYVAESSDDKKYNGAIIVFDDLERKSNNLKFESIYGTINSLRKIGFKIACIVYSQDIDDKQEYLNFAEKTFDSIVSVSADPSVFAEIVPEFEISIDETYLKPADDNWRLLIKASKICLDILSYMKSENRLDFLERMQLDSSSFYRCVLLALKCIYSKNEKKPSFSKDDTFRKFIYDDDVEKFGFFVANELNHIFATENGEYKTQVELLIESISEMNYSLIIDTYYPDNNSIILTESPFNEEPYFLDDEGKKEFKRKFFDRINEFDFKESIQERFLARFISQFINVLSEQEMCVLIDRIVQTIPYEEGGSFMRMMFMDEDYKSEKLMRFKNLLDTKFSEIKESSKRILLEEAFKKGDYSLLTDFLYKYRYYDEHIKEPIAKIFASHDYYLPDLSKKIDYPCWQYCHQTANFIASLESHKAKFIECLKKQCECSKSRSLRERCNSLVKSNFSERMNFFELYPID